jgi:hypothetical protein
VSHVPNLPRTRASTRAVRAEVLDEIGRYDAVTMLAQDPDDGSRPARRLPYDARQALDAQERARGDGRCLVEIIAAIAERVPRVV